MTDAAAKPVQSSDRPHRRARPSSLLQYVLLQALIVILCVVALQRPLPEPPARYAVAEFTLREGSDQRTVTLPDFTAARSTADDTPVFSGRFNWQDQEPRRAWSVALWATNGSG